MKLTISNPMTPSSSYDDEHPLIIEPTSSDSELSTIQESLQESRLIYDSSDCENDPRDLSYNTSMSFSSLVSDGEHQDSRNFKTSTRASTSRMRQPNDCSINPPSPASDDVVSEIEIFRLSFIFDSIFVRSTSRAMSRYTPRTSTSTIGETTLRRV
jgi:hypothetical protein